jgi:vanillate/3-O-methylgallate O-demethylase
MSANTSFRSLQDLIDVTPDLAAYLYNDTPGPHSRARAGLSPVPAEFSNWWDEQRAWRETAILFDQSHHMPELYVKGPDALRLLSSIGVNSLANLSPGIAKQFIGCTPRGQLVGDCILYDLGGQTYQLISSMPLLNWVEYQAQAGDWNVTLERDNNTSDNLTGRRRNFRFQLDGPAASEIFNEVTEGDTPVIKFFHTARVTIAGVEVLVLRHGMAGHAGVEISGPYEHGDRVRAAILDAGAKHGLRQGGTKSYFSKLYEEAWVAYPLPAIYTGEDLRGYRQWLPADGWEGKFSLSGSFTSKNIEEYYTTPYDLGYGHIVKFDHDFIGREALKELAKNPPRKRVSLVWNTDDVVRIYRSHFESATPFKYLDLPVADYGNMQHRDEVRTLDGQLIGLSAYTGYTVNERKILSLAILDTDHAAPGEEVTILWGEPDGGSRKPRVELHQQTLARATVAPAPYSSVVRQNMRQAVGPTA